MLNTKFSPWPSFSKEEALEVQRVILSNKVNYWTGNECREFEKEFAAWAGSRYAVAVANGTLALDLALKCSGIGAGDEVVVTSRTFIASASAVVTCGATPVFADVDLESQNITAETVRACITPKTKAVICVHLAGWPCEMDEILALSEEFDLVVIEDCAQAHGAKYKGRCVGTIGHIGCWSFCQDKIMSTGGEGGMVTTNDEALWRAMWAYKDHGKSFSAVYEREHPEGFRWLHESFGTNWRMSEIQGVLGRFQLRRMSEWHRSRVKNLEQIWATAARCEALRVPTPPSYIDHAAYKCYVFVSAEKLKAGWSRDGVVKAMTDMGVPCYQGSCSEVYLEKAFDSTGLRPEERLPNARELGETSLMFLVHPTLNQAEIDLTCAAIESVMELATR